MTLPGAPPLPPRGAPPLPPAAYAEITSPHAGNDLDYIRTAIHALQLYAEGATDDQELATVHQCILNLQKILAEDAKNQDAATGITPALKYGRRQTQRGTQLGAPRWPDDSLSATSGFDGLAGSRRVAIEPTRRDPTSGSW